MGNTYKAVFKKQRKLLENAPTEARNFAGILFSERVVPRTPVLTGKARANWSVSVGETPTFVSSLELDPSGAKTPRKIRAQIKQLPKTGKMFIANFLDYIEKLNRGSSRQAPAMFVQLVAAEVARFAPLFLIKALKGRGTRPTP